MCPKSRACSLTNGALRTEHRAQGIEPYEQSIAHRAQGTGHRALRTEHCAQSTGHRAQSLANRAQSTEHARAGAGLIHHQLGW